MKDDKHYELGLKQDFFRDEVIDWILEQENGTEYVLFYLKLCLKSLDNLEGVLIRKIGDKLVPYDNKKLAEITNTKIDIVISAMKLFEETNLIDILDDGEIYVRLLETMELWGCKGDC